MRILPRPPLLARPGTLSCLRPDHPQVAVSAADLREPRSAEGGSRAETNGQDVSGRASMERNWETDNLAFSCPAPLLPVPPSQLQQVPRRLFLGCSLQRLPRGIRIDHVLPHSRHRVRPRRDRGQDPRVRAAESAEYRGQRGAEGEGEGRAGSAGEGREGVEGVGEAAVSGGGGATGEREGGGPAESTTVARASSLPPPGLDSTDLLSPVLSHLWSSPLSPSFL